MADVDIAPEGQSALESPDTGIGNTAKEQEPFLKIDDSTFFNTPDEAVKAFREGTMRHSEHKKAMTELEERRRAHENEKTLWLRQQSEWDEKTKFYKDVDEFFKANPRAYAEVKKLVGQGASRSDIGEMINQMFEEKVGPKLSKIEEFEKQENAKAERARHFAELKKKYPDFDEEAVSKSYDQLMSPESTLGTLYEHLYHANRGRSIDPTQIQKETIDGLEKKSKSGFPSAKGTVHSTEKKANNLSIKQLAEQEKRKAGG
jgi:hypothetical protein